MKKLIATIAVLAPVVGAQEAKADYWTVPKLVKHSDGNPFKCRVSDGWGPKQNKCVVKVVWKDRPSIGREAFNIIDCESEWDERNVNPSSGATGLAQFLPSTWRRYKWRHKSPKHPVFNALQMRVVRMQDGNFHQWVCTG